MITPRTLLAVLLSSTCIPILTAADGGVSATLFAGGGFAGSPPGPGGGVIDATWPVSPLSGTPAAFSALWQGWITPRYAEPYTLVVKSSGGFRLLIDGVVALSGSGEAPATASVPLGPPSTTAHSFRLEYSDRDGSGRCSLYWRSASEGAAEVLVPATQLADLDRPLAKPPPTSPVSPACIEFERPHAATVVASGAGAGAVSLIDGCSGWADIPLAASGSTTTRLSVVRGAAWTAAITWAPTDVAAGGGLNIRLNDALLLSSPQDGELRVTNPGGRVSLIPVTAATPVPQVFNAPGRWQVMAHDGHGALVGSVQVAVAYITLPPRLACEVGYLRTVRSPAAPDGGIQVAASRPQLATVAAAATPITGRCSYNIKPAATGDVGLVYRLVSGTVLAACPLDAYVITSNFYTGNYTFVRDDQGYGHGFFQFAMTPRVDYAVITLDFLVTTVRIDGSSRIILNGSDLAADGTWGGNFVISPGQTRSCHRFKVTQEMPAPPPIPPSAVASRVIEITGRGMQP